VNTHFVKRWWPVVVVCAATVAALSACSYRSAGNRIGGASPAARPVVPTARGEAVPTAETSRGVEHATAGDFQEKVLSSAVPVLVDFYADWCPPCRAMAPVLEEFARETTDAKVVKVNVDENRELAARYEISVIPSLLVFRGGQLTGRHTGLVDKGALGQLLAQR